MRNHSSITLSSPLSDIWKICGIVNGFAPMPYARNCLHVVSGIKQKRNHTSDVAKHPNYPTTFF